MTLINKDLRIAGYIVNADVDEPVYEFERKHPFYRVTIEPQNPHFADEMWMELECELGPQCSEEELANIRKQIEGTLTFETINKPSVTCCINSGHLVDVSCRFELATTDDGLQYFLNPRLRFIDEHVSQDDPMTDVTEEERELYDF